MPNGVGAKKSTTPPVQTQNQPPPAQTKLEEVFVLRAVIFANGQYNTSYTPQAGDLVIAADGGARHCLMNGIRPAAVIGDLDSLESSELDALEGGGAQVFTYPSRKNHTDLELALEYALKFQPQEVLILAGLGGRWDQAIANILLAATSHAPRIRLVDGPQEFYFLHGGGKLEIQGRRDEIVSLIPLGGDAHGIVTEGLEYPLKEESLLFGSTRGISNVMLGDKATITLAEGFLLCTIIHSNSI